MDFPVWAKSTCHLGNRWACWRTWRWSQMWSSICAFQTWIWSVAGVASKSTPWPTYLTQRWICFYPMHNQHKKGLFFFQADFDYLKEKLYWRRGGGGGGASGVSYGSLFGRYLDSKKIEKSSQFRENIGLEINNLSFWTSSLILLGFFH